MMTDTTATFLDWYQTHFNEANERPSFNPTTMQGSYSFDALTPAERDSIDTFRKENSRFDDLWRGVNTAHFKLDGAPDMSVADHEFFCILIRATGCRDPRRLETMARCSGLYRPKWDRKDYLPRTIAKALAETPTAQETFEPGTTPDSTVTTDTPPTPAPKSRLHFELLDDIAPMIDRPALVGGLLDHGAMSVLYGESNSGKTFVATDTSFHVSANLPWMGRAVQPGLVVYIAAEGGGGIRNRCAALRLHYDVDALKAPFALIPCPVDLSGRGADVQPLLYEIAKAQEATKRAPVLVVIDTLSRALGGSNENAPEDMTAFIRNVDRLRFETKAHLMIVHHTGKDRAKGARGHSSLRAATDTELEIADWQIVTTKQRDRDIGPPIGFRLHSVEIGRDASGQAVTSCVVLPHNVNAEDEFRLKPPKPNSMTGRAWAVLEAITGGLRSVSAEAWRDEFCRQHYPGKRKLGWQSFQRAKGILSAEGHIVEDHRGVRCAR